MGQREFYEGLKGPAHEEFVAGLEFFANLQKEATPSFKPVKRLVAGAHKAVGAATNEVKTEAPKVVRKQTLRDAHQKAAVGWAGGGLREKVACGDIYSSSSRNGWVNQFEGTPLLPQAVALERQELQMEADDLSKRSAEDAERQARSQEDQARWASRDQIRLQKKELDLQLAEHRSGVANQGAGEEAMPELLAGAGDSMQDPAAPQVDPAAQIKTAGFMDTLNTLTQPRNAIPIGLGAAVGMGIGRAKYGPNKRFEGKSEFEVESQRDLDAQNSAKEDEGQMNFVKKLKRRAVEARPGVAKMLREHPVISTALSGVTGAGVGHSFVKSYDKGMQLLKKGPL